MNTNKNPAGFIMSSPESLKAMIKRQGNEDYLKKKYEKLYEDENEKKS